MKYIFLFTASILVFSASTSAQDSSFCKQINSVVEHLFSSPVSFHGQDKRTEEGMTISIPTILLENASECELTTSFREGEGTFFSYECQWPQNRGTSLTDAIQQGADLSKGIADCTGTKMTRRDVSPERASETGLSAKTWWKGRIKSHEKNMEVEVRVPATTKYQRIYMKFHGIY